MSLKEAVGKSGYSICIYSGFLLHRNNFSYFCLFYVKNSLFILCLIGILDEVIKPLRESKKWKVCYFFFIHVKYTITTAYTDLNAEFYYVLEG